MFWIFAAVIAVLCVVSAGARNVVGIMALGLFALFIGWYMHDNVFVAKPAPAVVTKDCPVVYGEDGRPTLDYLLSGC